MESPGPGGDAGCVRRDGGHWAPSPVGALAAGISLGLVGNLAAGTVQVRQWWWPPLAWAGTALLALASVAIEWARNRAEKDVTLAQARETRLAARPGQPRRSGPAGPRRIGAKAAGVCIASVALLALLTVLFRLPLSSVLVTAVSASPALYLAWLAVPGVVSVPEPPAAHEGQSSGTAGTAVPASLPAGAAPVLLENRTAPDPAVPVPARDLDGLSDERVELLRRSVEVFEEMVSVSVAIADATPLSEDFARLPARMQRSLERTQNQVAALQEGVDIAAGWPDGTWVMDFRAALERARRMTASLNWHPDRTTVSGASAAETQDSQVRQCVGKLLSLLQKQYPSLFRRT